MKVTLTILSTKDARPASFLLYRYCGMCAQQDVQLRWLADLIPSYTIAESE